MKKFAPNAYLTAPAWNWEVIYKEIAEQLHKGTWKPEKIWWGMDKDVVQLAPVSDYWKNSVPSLLTGLLKKP